MTTKTNIELIDLINNLKKQSLDEKVKIWKDVAIRLEKPLKNFAAVNVSKIERYAKDEDIILIPGKVLGAGNLNKKLTVIAYRFSKEAKEKIEAIGGKTMSIKDALVENPKGSNIRIFR
jgi:large subunit ribosomal protein L18e